MPTQAHGLRNWCNMVAQHVGYVGYANQIANTANTMRQCARSILRAVGGM
jgi:hypothetical protein